MAASVHLPPPLLESVDHRARQLKVSRNRLIIRALERELAHPSDWSPGFFEALTPVDDDLAREVDALQSGIASARTRKEAPSW